MSDLVIEILSFTGCPNAEQARSNAQEAARQEGVVAQMAEVEVDTPELALSHKFLGSPSVRVDGTDVEEEAEMRREYGLMCRAYNDGKGFVGVPSIEMIREAIKRRSTDPTI